MIPSKNYFNYFKAAPRKEHKYLVVLLLFALITLFNVSPVGAASTCAPSSARMCAAVDDYADIWINGNLIGNFPYCDSGNAGCQPLCIDLDAAQMNALTNTNNYIAVKNQNTAMDEVWASWSLDITCTTPSGAHVYVSSDDAGIKMYDDPTCAKPGLTPPPSGGYNWYETLYNQAGSGLSWVDPVDMTTQKWGKRLQDPRTHSVLHAQSWAASYPKTDCHVLYFRQGFDMTPQPTMPPPIFSITKFATPVSAIGQNTPYSITFVVRVCNTGGGTGGTPVVIHDLWSDTSDSWEYKGPWTYTDGNMGKIIAATVAKGVDITFSDGFPANTCYDYQFFIGINNGMPTFCATWHNVADLAYLAEPIKEATVTLNNYCPPPPNLTLIKTASKTTGIVQGDNISYNLHLCNTGGPAWSGTAQIFDDFSSNNDNWNWLYNTYYGDPAPGIDHININRGTRQATIDIVFEQPGFTGCVDIPLGANMQTKNIGSCSWVNNASLSYFASPTVFTSVNMADLCTPTPLPPVWSISKTANKTSNIAVGDLLTFTLHICNTGGVVTSGTIDVLDDFSSSTDVFQYDGPNWTNPGVAGINHYVNNNSGNTVTYTIYFESPGFGNGACLDIPMRLHETTKNCCTWHNNASILQATPAAVSTVDMINAGGICASPTITPTITVSPTLTPTLTSTPLPIVVQLTKTISKNTIMLGETFTYCLNYKNTTGSTASFRIWDTIPLVCDYVGTDTAGQTIVPDGSYSIIYWDLANIPNNGAGTICFYVKAARLPFLRFDEYLAWMNDMITIYATARGNPADCMDKI